MAEISIAVPQVEARLELVEKLAPLAIFGSIEPHLIGKIAAEFVWFSIPGGEVLFRQGDQDDSLYIVLSGRLGAFLPNDEGKEVLIRQMQRGETVGEMAVLSGDPRSATVVALRDTELVRLSKKAFDQLIDEYPKSLRFITDLLVRRLKEPPRLAASHDAPRTVAILPLNADLAASGFVPLLAKAFRELGLKTTIVDRTFLNRPIEWFSAIEEEHDVLLYQADPELSEWTQHCLRQADRVVLLVEATRSPSFVPAAFEAALNNPRRAITELVLYRDQSVSPSETVSLLKLFPATQHHHVRRQVPRDFRRLARMIVGRAIGLVLSGGGARAYAHIGVLRALRESGLEVDLVGGASMGAIIGGAVALEWDDQVLRENFRIAFTVDNPAGDYTFPLISLVRGKRTTKLLRSYFRDTLIENCPIPYYCVSANLTTSLLKVHRGGLLWLATRASCAIPGVLPPVIEGSEILIDGGILNNLPIDIMSEMRRGQIIAANVSSDYSFKSTIDDIDHRPLWELFSHARQGTPNILRLLMSAGTIGATPQLRRTRNLVDVMIEPQLSEISILDWKSFDFAVDAGYRHAMEILEKSKGTLFSKNPSPSTPA